MPPNPPDDYFETPEGIVYGDPPFWWGTPDDWNIVFTSPDDGGKDEE